MAILSALCFATLSAHINRKLNSDLARSASQECAYTQNQPNQRCMKVGQVAYHASWFWCLEDGRGTHSTRVLVQCSKTYYTMKHVIFCINAINHL
jgi:hypothetical protein